MRPRHRLTTLWRQFLVTFAGLVLAVVASGVAILVLYDPSSTSVDAAMAP